MDFLKKIPHHMDYEGQHLAERIFQVLIVAHGIIGFVIGYIFQQFSFTVYTVGFGFALAALIILPPWPYFRRHSLNWQKPSSNATASSSTTSGANTKQAATKKKNK